MLGLLEGTGIINLLVYDDEVILKKDGITVQLTGRSYNYEIDGENFRNYYIVKKTCRCGLCHKHRARNASFKAFL